MFLPLDPFNMDRAYVREKLDLLRTRLPIVFQKSQQLIDQKASEEQQLRDQRADTVPPPTVAAGNVPPPLPPSVEAAYKKKCIELKRRLIEVDEDNDAKRLRIARLHRGIRKMRLERAYLLEALAKRQKKNGSSVDGFPVAYDEESEGSSEGPPTVRHSNQITSPCAPASDTKSLTVLSQPNEKPLRSKRSHRRPVSSPPPMLGPQFPRPIAPSQGHPTSAFDVPGNHPFRESSYQQAPTTNGHPGLHFQHHQSPYASNVARDPHQQQQQILPRAAPPPTNAFDDFVENFIQVRPNEFPARNPDELVQYARAVWDDPQKVEYRRVYEERYVRRYQEYMESVNELEERERYERERGYEQRGRAGRYEEREAETELPPPPPPAAPAAGAGALGGFTSING